MRVLQIINALTYGGAQLLLLDLARETKVRGHDTLIVCFRDGPVGNVLRQEGFQVEVLGETTLDLPAFFKLKAIINYFRPDLIHSHLFRATFWVRIAILFSRIKLITSVHGIETRYYHCLEKLLAFKTARFIFPSCFLKDWYDKSIKHLPKEKAEVIFPGVTIGASFEPPAAQSKTIKIGTLSRLHRVKGLDSLIEVCADLKMAGHDFELHIAGDGRQKGELQKLADDRKLSSSCFFHDEINNKDEYLASLSCFAAPSRQEAFGINICEAMERGLAVAASNVGGIPEIIENNKNGLLFEPDDRKSMFEALKRLITDSDFRQSAGKNARKKVTASFDRHEAINQYMSLYERYKTETRSVHFAISSSELGGGERVALGIMSALKERRWKVSATCAGAPLADKLSEAGIKVSSSSMRAGGLFFAARLFTDLVKNRPRIISSHLNRASLWSGLIGKLLGIRSVSHVHGLNQKNYYKHSDHLIAVSQAVKNHLVSQNMPETLISTIPNRINKTAFNHRNYAENTTITIAITAKLHKNKGHRWALEALAAATDKLPPFKLILIGDGPERHNIEKLCKKLKMSEKVKFTGFVQDPEKFYDKVDLALLPSLGEGIPLSLLEVMRWGIPCVASNTGGIPEIISSGKNGILVTPGNAQQLIEAIREICHPGNYKRFSQSAISCFSQLNNYSSMIDEIEHTFSETAVIDK